MWFAGDSATPATADIVKSIAGNGDQKPNPWHLLTGAGARWLKRWPGAFSKILP